jgi:hypothetical protein
MTRPNAEPGGSRRVQASLEVLFAASVLQPDDGFAVESHRDGERVEAVVGKAPV